MTKTKPCPNCVDGYEDSPPMRKCGICRGRGRVPIPSTTKDVQKVPNRAHVGAERRENDQ